MGSGLLRHDQHRHLRDGAGDPQPRGRVGERRLVERRVPATARRGRSALRICRRRLLGGRRHPPQLPEGQLRRPRWPDPDRHRRVRGLQGRLGRRGRRRRPRRGPQGSALRRCLRQGRRRCRTPRPHRGRRQRRHPARSLPAPGGRPRQRLHRSAHQPSRLRRRQEHRRDARAPASTTVLWSATTA